MIIKGIDISYYDSTKQLPGGSIAYLPLEWNKYDWDFAFIKASEGTVMDKAFRIQWAAAKGYTIRGAYHFFRSFVDPKIAAQFFADYLDGDMGELPPILDLETDDGRADCISRAITWLIEFKRITHIQPMIYSSMGFLDSVHASEYAELGDYKLWLAQYPFDKWDVSLRVERLRNVLYGSHGIIMPLPPKPFKRVSFLQWTGKGNPKDVPGYISDKLAVDFNFYNGPSLEDMMREFNIQWMPNTQQETIMIQGKIVRSPTNIRSTPPGGAYVDIGDLPIGALIEASAKRTMADGASWYLLTKAIFNGENIRTTSGRLVNEVEAWVFGNNVEEITISIPNDRTVTGITIDNPEKVVVTYSDGTTQIL